MQLPNIFTKHERPQDINTESFGPLLPIAKAVDDATGGWGLSYADLHPATPRTRLVFFIVCVDIGVLRHVKERVQLFYNNTHCHLLYFNHTVSDKPF